MTGAQDLQFHWQRIEELRESIKAGNWLPQFAINQFNGVGSAVMTFYPYLTLIPIALLSFVIKSKLALVFVTFIILTFVSMLIAYYSSLGVNKDSATSYLFATIYGLSITHLAYYFYMFDLGICLSLIVLPLVIFGFIAFINNYKWMEMSVGITLVIFSHVLNSLFVIFFLFIWLLINYRRITNIILKKLLKVILTITCTTCALWLPSLFLYHENKLTKPVIFQLNGVSLQNIFTDALSNTPYFYLNFFNIISVTVLAILFYKKFNRTIKQMYWLSVAIVIVSSNIFPWHLFQNSLNIIQFPWRLLIFSEILLDYIFAISITRYIKIYQIRRILYLVTLGLVMVFSLNSQCRIVTMYKGYSNFIQNIPLDIPYKNGHPSFKISKSSQFSNISKFLNNEDYYIKKSKVFTNQLVHDQGLYNFNKTLQFNNKKDGEYIFNNNSGFNIQELNLPFLDYRGENYDVYLDHHKVASHPNQNRILTINNVKQGNHTVKIVPTVTVLTRASRIISIIGVLLYVFFALAKLFRKIKITRRKKKIKAVE